jgi:hypothetical protein
MKIKGDLKGIKAKLKKSQNKLKTAPLFLKQNSCLPFWQTLILQKSQRQHTVISELSKGIKKRIFYS